jgi:hypothetical protein
VRRADNLATSCADCQKSWYPQLPGVLRAYLGLCRDNFTFYMKIQEGKTWGYGCVCGTSHRIEEQSQGKRGGMDVVFELLACCNVAAQETVLGFSSVLSSGTTG